MRAGYQLTDASATPVGKVSEGHAGSVVREKRLVDVAHVVVIVADKLGHAVEAVSFILAKMENEGNQGGQDGAVVDVWEAFAQAKKDLFSRVQTSFVETVSG